jgi:hypothetical protein
MAAFDDLQRASFAGIEFPVEEIAIDGGIRDHVHEYPHSPGGASEKLGRKLYVFKLKAPFHATFRKYPQLWPQRWNRLRNIFEAERTEDLVVPTLGTVKAYCFAWPELATSRKRSGISADLSFREDSSDSYLINGLLGVGFTAVQEMKKVLYNAARIYEQTPPGQIMLDALPPDYVLHPLRPPFDEEKTGTLNLLDLIDMAANDLLAVQDQQELATTIVDIKLGRLLSLCQQLDRRRSIGDPANAPLRDAFAAVWSSADERRRDLAQKRASLFLYTTPLEMSVNSVSTAIYGDSSRAMEVLQLNAIRNAFAIPKGTALLAYRPGVKAKAA